MHPKEAAMNGESQYPPTNNVYKISFNDFGTAFVGAENIQEAIKIFIEDWKVRYKNDPPIIRSVEQLSGYVVNIGH